MTNVRKNNCFRYLHATSTLQDVELTSVRHPSLKRGNYSVVADDDISEFKRLLPGAERVITDPSELQGYNTDWVKNCRGKIGLEQII